jgi:hypothetical protein
MKVFLMNNDIKQKVRLHDAANPSANADDTWRVTMAGTAGFMKTVA